MKAMILAAGLGQRMRPLTDHIPKPLLQVNGKCLLDYHLEKIQDAGITEVIINLAYLGDKIREHLQDHPYKKLTIKFSQEPEPLETGGALLQAANLLADENFLLVNGDVWSDISYKDFIIHHLQEPSLGHLLMVPNPDFHPQGDFTLDKTTHKLGEKQHQPGLTFAGISILSPQLIGEYPHKRSKFPLAEVFFHAIKNQQLTGELYNGYWSDVGTPQRLQSLDQFLRSQHQEPS
jgi:N-acetyl-alpha-D-muramate 1-phosphate uridylyltransferase